MSDRQTKPAGDIESVEKNPDYTHVCAVSRHVYPGGLTVNVVKHNATGTLWAKNIMMDDDTSFESGDWYRVVRQERVIVDYVRPSEET